MPRPACLRPSQTCGQAIQLTSVEMRTASAREDELKCLVANSTASGFVNTSAVKRTESWPLYFDTAATTRVAPEVLAAMVEALESATAFANPSSGGHLPGREAANSIEAARSTIAQELGCLSDEIVFTSGATESINLALQGVARGYSSHGRHIVTSRIEHKATLACCAALEQDGFEVTYLSPGRDGRVPPESRGGCHQAGNAVGLHHADQ